MIRISWVFGIYLAAAIAILAGSDQPEQAIDTERSFLTIYVGKAGLLSAAAREHWVNAPIAGGTIDADGTREAVWFTVDARGLSVRPEKGARQRPRRRAIQHAEQGAGISYLCGHRFQIDAGPRTVPLYGEGQAT